MLIKYVNYCLFFFLLLSLLLDLFNFSFNGDGFTSLDNLVIKLTAPNTLPNMKSRSFTGISLLTTKKTIMTECASAKLYLGTPSAPLTIKRCIKDARNADCTGHGTIFMIPLGPSRQKNPPQPAIKPQTRGPNTGKEK